MSRSYFLKLFKRQNLRTQIRVARTQRVHPFFQVSSPNNDLDDFCAWDAPACHDKTISFFLWVLILIPKIFKIEAEIEARNRLIRWPVLHVTIIYSRKILFLTGFLIFELFYLQISEIKQSNLKSCIDNRIA